MALLPALDDRRRREAEVPAWGNSYLAMLLARVKAILIIKQQIQHHHTNNIKYPTSSIPYQQHTHRNPISLKIESLLSSGVFLARWLNRLVYNDMSLIYTVVARQEVILSQFTPFSGNFVLTAQQILKRCSPNRKYSKFSASNYIFYVLYDELVFMVMADTKYSERIAFSYLDNIRKIFVTTYPAEKTKKMGMYGAMDFGTVLRNNMQLYNSPEEVDNVAKLWKETEEVNQILNQDLQKLLDREEKIQILVKKTETMSALSLDMVGSTRTIKHAMIWQNWKMRILLFFAVLLVIYFIMVMVCGGVTLSGCF